MRDRFLLMLVVVTCAVFLIFAIQDDAEAAEEQRCKFIGITNIYAGPGDTVDIFTDNTYRDYRCDMNGVKVQKVVYNTRLEFLTLRPYIQDVTKRTRMPIAMCWDGNKGRVWASSWFWSTKFKRPTLAKRDAYEAFLERTGCKVYG